MNNASLEVLFARRPTLNYVSPAICEAAFSSTSFPTLVLSPTPTKGKITGLVINYLGEGGDFELLWDNFPGVLCYSVYKLRNTIDPFGEYQLVAECITDPRYNPADWPLDDPNEPGCYVITAITAEGETEFGDPICNGCAILPEGPFDALASEIYSQQLTLAGLPTTPDVVVWAISSGALPAGVTIDAATGLLSGVVGETGEFHFTVLVNGLIGDVPFIGSRDYVMVVTTTAIECFVIPDSVFIQSCDEDYSVIFAPLSGTGVLWELVSGAFPDGLLLNPATGELSGTPTTVGVFNFSLRVTKADASICENDFIFTVEQSFPDFTFTDLGINLTQISAATINGLDLLAPDIITGDTFCSRSDIEFTTKNSPPGGFNISFDASDTVEAGQDGTYRVFVDNAKLHLATLSPPANLLVLVYKNSIEVFRYELAFNTGQQFVDVPLSEGDVLEYIFTTDGVDPIVDTYNTSIWVEKLP